MSNTILPSVQTKEVGIAYLLWFFLGGLGGHKFYLGKTGLGVAYLFTGGFLLIGVIVDAFTLPRQVRAYNDQKQRDVLTMQMLAKQAAAA